MTLSELKRTLLGRENTLENPYLEVRVLLSHLGISETEQIAFPERPVSPETAAKAVTLFEKRINGTPMAYITGEKEFYGHTFHVDESVLIPRPDTEILVEKAIETYRRKKYTGRILDLCTGSGAIASSVSYALGTDVAFSDISSAALRIAELNYREITHRSTYDSRLGDLFEPWTGERFSLIATNPPYLTREWYEETERSVKKEPEGAFIGFGDDGMDIIKKIVLTSPQVLEKNGTLLIECDYRQAGALASFMTASGFVNVETARDLGGLERVVYGEYEG